MEFITYKGAKGIIARVICDSVCSITGKRMRTYEIEYPRMVLAELNTHRMLPKNSASSRAIPFAKMLEQLTAEPIRFGAANPGMQDKGEEHTEKLFGSWGQGKVSPSTAWQDAKFEAIRMAEKFHGAGYHKQVYNRLTEPFQMIKTVISGTEWENFFWLRDDDMADPTLRELARCMKEAAALSTPVVLKPGQWHLPYIDTFTDEYGTTYFIETESGGVQEITLEEAIKVSCARCAAVSYRNEGYGLAKCIELFERLVGAEKKHASALEHCATPMEAHKHHTDLEGITTKVNVCYDVSTWQEGISHMDRKGRLWSGPLCGWVQFRKTIPGENMEG